METLNMGLLLWIIFGAIAGWLASLFLKTNSGQSTMMDIVLGIAGAIGGGFLMEQFGQPGITGFNLYSMFVAVIGAIIIVYIGRMIKK